MPSNAAHAKSSWIMHFAAQHVIVIVELRGGDLRTPGFRRKIARMLHLQRGENVLRGVVVQALARNLLHECPKHDEIDVAIDEAGARWSIGLLCKRHFVCGVFPFPWRLEIKIGREPGIVRQQLPDSDVFFAVLPEIRQILHHRVADSHLPALHQLHH